MEGNITVRIGQRRFEGGYENRHSLEQAGGRDITAGTGQSRLEGGYGSRHRAELAGGRDITVGIDGEASNAVTPIIDRNSSGGHNI